MSRTSQGQSREFTIEDIVADIQRGIYKGRSFTGTVQSQGLHTAVNTLQNYSGATILRDEVGDSDNGKFRLSNAQWAKLVKRAGSMSRYNNIPQDTCEDFLLILCYINKLSDMAKIAEEVDLPELNSEAMLRNVDVILDIPGLEKAGYTAQALSAIIKMFSKYASASQIVSSNPGQDIFQMLSGFALGSMSETLLDSSNPSALVGNFLSELITGERIPTNVIAKNPNNQSPSYVGKAFFGEAATSLSVVDITEIFAKKIAVFPIGSAGAGVTSFSLQNSRNFSNILPLDQFISQMNFGSINITSDFKQQIVNDITDKVNSMLGTTSDEIVDIRRADTAIPLQMALSAVHSNSERSLFNIDTFRDGWIDSNAVTKVLSQSNPEFMSAVKRLF